MKYRDAFFLLLAAGLALFSLAGIATSGYGASALHAQSAGFDALAYAVLGSGTCSTTAQVTDEGEGPQ